MINFKIDDSGLRNLKKQLSKIPDQIPAASAAALNRTMDHVGTQWARLIVARYAIKPSEVKGIKDKNGSRSGAIRRHYASKSDMNAFITIHGHRLTMAHFPHSPLAPAGNRRGVRVRILKGGGMKSFSTRQSPFVMKTGARSSDKVQFNVFKRLTNKRFPVYPIRTLSIPQMAAREEIMTEVQKVAQKKLEERISHEVDYRLKKAGFK